VKHCTKDQESAGTLELVKYNNFKEAYVLDVNEWDATTHDAITYTIDDYQWQRTMPAASSPISLWTPQALPINHHYRQLGSHICGDSARMNRAWLIGGNRRFCSRYHSRRWWLIIYDFVSISQSSHEMVIHTIYIQVRLHSPDPHAELCRPVPISCLAAGGSHTVPVSSYIHPPSASAKQAYWPPVWSFGIRFVNLFGKHPNRCQR